MLIVPRPVPECPTQTAGFGRRLTSPLHRFVRFTDDDEPVYLEAPRADTDVPCDIVPSVVENNLDRAGVVEESRNTPLRVVVVGRCFP